MNKTIIPSKILNEFFETILNRRFSEADKVLQEIERKIGEVDNNFKRGFLQGLKGILYMYRSNDQDTFLSTLDLTNINALKKYYSEFLEDSKKKLHSDYDRGYFSALAGYIRFILKSIESKQKS
ncbi:MAG: hypothetical protein QXX56_03145 [Candidatus Bathyarchaeia archaeon]